jgi:hypothetical protein
MIGNVTWLTRARRGSVASFDAGVPFSHARETVQYPLGESEDFSDGENKRVTYTALQS